MFPRSERASLRRGLMSSERVHFIERLSIAVLLQQHRGKLHVSLLGVWTLADNPAPFGFRVLPIATRHQQLALQLPHIGVLRIFVDQLRHMTLAVIETSGLQLGRCEKSFGRACWPDRLSRYRAIPWYAASGFC